MISVLRCVDGQLVFKLRGDGAKHHVLAESFTRPMPATEEQQAQPFYGIDFGVEYRRLFRRVKVLRDPTRQGADGHPDGEVFGFLYFEDDDVQMPPEILSRRMQEVEAEWLRLGRLLEVLREKERRC